MKVFVWERVERCTSSWHPEGGVVVFADTLEEAKDMASKFDGCAIGDDELPNEIRECSDGEKKVFLMPDAGCC